MNSLDLFSTSQTYFNERRVKNGRVNRKTYDACLNNAPYFAYKIEGKKWGVVQGCCNDWLCPRCGLQRAREEYGRIVAGARKISETDKLYLLTITCRGKEMSLEDAEANYVVWTNRLLTRLRTQAKRSGKPWFYAGVTERQSRGHPHSHYITTYCPNDAVDVEKGREKYFHTSGESFVAKHNTIQSAYVESACVECGLGRQYDLSRIESFEAGSRYVAKYLFKESVLTEKWPKGWRRVRYSQNWPKLPEKETEAFILMESTDWIRLSRQALIIQTKNSETRELVERRLRGADVIVT